MSYELVTKTVNAQLLAAVAARAHRRPWAREDAGA